MSKPTLTIVIPAYNEEARIGHCLDSIAAQTIPPDEVIVVDNNSTDKTAAIAKTYPFVTVVRETQQGRSWARDKGLHTATGSLLARIDADTRLPKNWVETAHDTMDKHADEIYALSGPVYAYDIRNKFLARLFGDAFFQYTYYPLSRLMLGHDTLLGANMIMTRKAWLAVQNEVCHNCEEMHEDMDLALHIADHGTITFDKSLVAYISKRGFSSVIWRLKAWVKSVTQHRKLFAKRT